MDMQNKQRLGWGLVGSSNGRQYTSDGIDKQFGLGKVFELGQELGSCLPHPKSGDFIPLYALVYRNINNTPILGFAEYLSIHEMGQDRAGSYFGSFVEVAGASFSTDSISTIFGALRELSIYQVEHFIDKGKRAYHTSINGKSFNAPQLLLDKIAEQIQPLTGNYLTQTEQMKDLFIHCEQGQVEKVAEKLLEEPLFYIYKNIFFSENSHICHQVEHKRITQINASDLLCSHFFTQPWKMEVRYLQALAQQLHQEKQSLEQEYQRIIEEQEQKINRAVKEKTQQFVQITQENVQTYKQEAEHYKRLLTEFNYDTVLKEKRALEDGLDKLKKESEQQKKELHFVESKVVFSNRVAMGFGILFIIFLLILVVSGIYVFSQQNKNSGLTQENKELEASKKEITIKGKNNEK